MAELNVTQQEIYKDVRAFLLGLFPGSEKQIIQAAQNNNPLPNNAVVMQVLFSKNLDIAVVTPLPPTEAAIQNSVELRMQIDFYGVNAEARSRIVANLWRTGYTCDLLTTCQPLYVQSHDRHIYVNDSNQYEDRWIIDLGLQYNPQVTVAQGFSNSPPVITIVPVSE
jgi:hypothetical protein